MQGVLYPKGSIISQVLLAIILLLSMKAMIDVNRMNNKPIYFKGLNIMVGMFTFYGLLLFVTDGTIVKGLGGFETQSMNYLKSAYMSLLPIYVSFIYTVTGRLTLKHLQFWAILFICIAVTEYFEQQQEALVAALERGSTREEFTNNAGYILMSLIPLMMVYDRKPIYQLTGLGICAYFVIIAMKRGAVLVAIIALMMFVWYKLKSVSGIKKTLVVLCIGVGFLLITRFVQEMMSSSDFFYARVQSTFEGDTSNRDLLYADFWNHFAQKASVLEMLFGGGGYNTIKVSFNYAHNDWLEILTNNGVLGILLFITYWIYFYKTTRMTSLCNETRFCLLLVFSMYLLRTLFSMSIANMNVYITSILGFALADGLKQLHDDNCYQK